MNIWEVAILTCINSLHGEADLQEIYKHIGNFIILEKRHLEETRYGGRPAYQHQVRSHITNLCQAGDLIRISIGRYSLTKKGQKRIK
jgi:hypothetical protein